LQIAITNPSSIFEIASRNDKFYTSSKAKTQYHNQALSRYEDTDMSGLGTLDP